LENDGYYTKTQVGSAPTPYKQAMTADAPEGNIFDIDSRFYFETFAVATAGPQRGKVYGGLSWGFDADDNGKLTSHPVSLIGGPTPELYASIAAYNKQCTLPADEQTAPPQVPLGRFR
jgi:hypothetical protein